MKKKIIDLISELAWTNIEPWHEKDKARTDDAHEVARAKNIDKFRIKK